MNAVSSRPEAEPRHSAPRHTLVIAAGGTGGHFIPAEALGAELSARGHRVVLMTDGRSGGQDSPVFAGPDAHVLAGAGIVGRGAGKAMRGALALASGTLQARGIMARLNARVVIGFGGYPSVPPVLAARLLRHRPRVILHEGNAVLGQANRSLARFADHIALSMARTLRVPPRTPATLTGIPIRAGIAALHGGEYHPPEPGGPIHLLVTGGSLGARVLSQAVPAAIALLPADLRRRLVVTQQCRAEDLEGVRAAYAQAGVPAELAPFLEEMPRRLAEAHFVIARAGASTVAELAVVGRPALLVPLPSTDSHQRHNAVAIDAGVLEQGELAHSPAALADILAHRLDCPDMLSAGAHAIAQHGIADAARRLADLVETTALPIASQGTPK